MPVITCPHCGKKTIDSSDTCLICGEKINKTPKKKSSEETQAKINKKPILVPIVISLILFGAFIIIQNFDTKNDSEPVLVSTASSDTTDYTAQTTDAPTQTPTLTDDDIELADRHNFHLNYDVLWGSDMNTVEKSMGAPDKYGEDYMVYKSILFDSYPADAVFYFHDNGLIWASMKFHIDSRKTAVSYFEDIQEILTNEFGDPLSETSDLNLYDLTKKIHGYLYWEQPNSKITLNLSNSYTDFDDILTYSYADSSAIPSRASLDKMINDSAEQPTESSEKTSLEDVERRNLSLDADTDFGEYFGTDISEIIDTFGIPDKYGDNYVVYKNIMFDIYCADAVFNLKNGKFESVALKFHDMENAAQNFQSISGMLKDIYGNYEECGNLHDFTKTLDGYIKWEQPNSYIILSNFNLILAYAPYPYLPKYNTLYKMINNPQEQPTEAPDKPASETVIRRNSDYNANVDYGEYWGCDMAAIEEEFGTPDEYDEDSMIYKSILFGTYDSEVSFEFDGGGLCSVTVEFNSYYFMLEDRLKILLMNKFGEFDISLGRNNPTWITPESKVKLYTSRITYEKNQ